jgi:hypothetical protein
MARLAAQAKGEYYPTPLAVVTRIARHITVPSHQHQFLRLYDPCAGKGQAIAHLRQALRSQTESEIQAWGSEIHPGRAQEASERLDHVVAAPLEAMDWKPAHGLASILFLNPPYDWDENHRGKRVESYFLHRSTQALVPEGLLIYLINANGLDWEDVSFIIRNYHTVRVYRFPDQAYQTFGQFIVLGIRRDQPASQYDHYHEKTWLRDHYSRNSRSANRTRIAESTPVIGSNDPVRTLCPRSDDPIVTYPGKLIQSHQAKLYRFRWGQDEIKAALTSPPVVLKGQDDGPIETVLKLKQGHMTQTLLSGLGGTFVLADQDEVIKGISIKSTEREVRDDHTVAIRTKWKNHIVRVTPEEGVEYWKGDKALPYLRENADRLITDLANRIQPYGYDTTPDELSKLGQLSQDRPWPTGEGSGLYPNQKETVIAALRALERYGVVHLIAEMGYGKTTCAAATMAMRDEWPVLVMGPPHLIKKWQREIEAVIPDVRAVIVKSLAELHQVIAEQRILKQRLVVIMKNTTASLGPGWDKAAFATRYTLPEDDASREAFHQAYEAYQARREALRTAPEASRAELRAELAQFRHRILSERALSYRVCPRCGQPVTDDELSGSPPYYCPKQDRYLHPETFPLPEDEVPPAHGQCEESLFQYVRNVDRWPLGDYIASRYPDFFKFLVVDEVHEYKSKYSSRGKAYGRLSAAIGPTMNLTGTFYGGYASSIFYLLMRSQSTMYQQGWEYQDERRFIEQYGRIERTYRTTEVTKEGVAEKSKLLNAKEIPGISPHVLRHILATSIFRSVNDLGIELPPYRDKVIYFPMEPDQAKDYQRMNAFTWDQVDRYGAAYLSSWLQWGLARPNSGFRREVVDGYRAKDGTYVLNPVVDRQTLGALLPKEEWLVKKCRTEVKRGRRTVIYLRQTGTRDIRGRIVEILQACGIDAQVLPDNVKPIEREVWLKKNDVDVLIVNPRRVQTGLDLVMYNTAIFYEIEYSLYTLWQASARLHRPGQEKRVEVYYLAYEETLEARAIQLISKKMAAGQMLYGDDIEGALAEQTSDNSFARQLLASVKHEESDTAPTTISGEELAELDVSAGAENAAYDLIPAEVAIPNLYQSDEDDPIAVVKLFLGDFTWYLTEYDPEQNVAFGFTARTCAPSLSEWGYIDIGELAAVTATVKVSRADGTGKGMDFQQPVERDLWFEPTPMREISIYQEAKDTDRAGGDDEATTAEQQLSVFDIWNDEQEETQQEAPLPEPIDPQACQQLSLGLF